MEFSFELPPSLAQTSYAISVDKHTIEHVFPVIRQGVNDQLWFEYNAQLDNIIIAEGNYDIYQLADAVRAALQLVDPGFDVVFDDRNYKLSLVVPSNTNFALIRTHFDPLARLNFLLTDRTDRCLEVLGWNFDQSNRLDLNAGPSDFTWIPDNIVRVRSTAWLHLNIDRHVTQTFSTDPFNPDRTLARIPLVEPYGSLIHYQDPNPPMFILEHAAGTIFTIYFTDEWGSRIRMGNNKNCVVGFQLRFSPLPSM